MNVEQGRAENLYQIFNNFGKIAIKAHEFRQGRHLELKLAALDRKGDFRAFRV